MRDKGKALKDLLYMIDGMCDSYRKENFGEAKEWVSHVNDAYSAYQEVTDDKLSLEDIRRVHNLTP